LNCTPNIGLKDWLEVVLIKENYQMIEKVEYLKNCKARRIK
jgi:hypothetical protein